MGKNGPNKTVAAFRKRCPFPAKPYKPEAFMEWLSDQAKSGVLFKTMQEAQEAFNKATNGN